MRCVGIKSLKNRLSEFVTLAASGESIFITNRGRIVAELGPLRDSRNTTREEEFLADAVRSGELVPAAIDALESPPKPPPVMNLSQILAELDESRSDR